MNEFLARCVIEDPLLFNNILCFLPASDALKLHQVTRLCYTYLKFYRIYGDVRTSLICRAREFHRCIFKAIVVDTSFLPSSIDPERMYFKNDQNFAYGLCDFPKNMIRLGISKVHSNELCMPSALEELSINMCNNLKINTNIWPSLKKVRIYRSSLNTACEKLLSIPTLKEICIILCQFTNKTHRDVVKIFCSEENKKRTLNELTFVPVKEDMIRQLLELSTKSITPSRIIKVTVSKYYFHLETKKSLSSNHKLIFGVTSKKFQSIINHIVNHPVLAHTFTRIKFDYGFNQKINQWSPSIKKITFDPKCEYNLPFECLPESLQVLKLNHFYTQPILAILPPHLELFHINSEHKIYQAKK